MDKTFASVPDHFNDFRWCLNYMGFDTLQKISGRKVESRDRAKIYW